METISAPISCKLNSSFTKDLELKSISIKKKRYTDPYYGERYAIPTLKDSRFKDAQISIDIFSGQCCGITEIVFAKLYNLWKEHYQNKLKKFSQILAKYITAQLKHKDQRIVFCGLPVEVGNGSQYDINFYNDIKTCLLGWGFVQLSTEPYLNKNSKNKILVFAGQIP